MEYEEAVNKLGSFIGTNTWHDYMGGSYLPTCEEKSGIIKSLSIIFDKDINRVKIDLDSKEEEQFKSMKPWGN